MCRVRAKILVARKLGRELFCSRLNFRATRIFTRATHSSSFARERLLRRLEPGLISVIVSELQ